MFHLHRGYTTCAPCPSDFTPCSPASLFPCSVATSDPLALPPFLSYILSHLSIRVPRAPPQVTLNPKMMEAEIKIPRRVLEESTDVEGMATNLGERESHSDRSVLLVLPSRWLIHIAKMLCMRSVRLVLLGVGLHIPYSSFFALRQMYSPLWCRVFYHFGYVLALPFDLPEISCSSLLSLSCADTNYTISTIGSLLGTT